MTAIAVTAEGARHLTDKIKVAVEGTWHLIAEAYTSHAWAALGYLSWDDYCTREFGTSRLRLPREDRQETVASLRDSGLSIRAIASVTGDSKDTVQRALAGVSGETPAPALRAVADAGELPDDFSDGELVNAYDGVTDDQFEAGLTAARTAGDLLQSNVIDHVQAVTEVAPAPKITGLDGKQYTAPKPAAPRRRSIADQAADAGFEIRRAVDKVSKLVCEDDRYSQNEKQVALALRGHLLHVAETVAAVLDQLPPLENGV